jgi:hypothetical protein
MAARLWPRAWAFWIAGVLGSFALLEEAAFRRNKHLTLSRVMNRWLGRVSRWASRKLGLGPDNSCRWIGAAAFALFWAALSVHFVLIDADQEAGTTQEVPS